MIQESIDFAFHFFLAPKYLVELGLLQEIIAIKYRQKRLNNAWQEHREKSKTEILAATSKLKNKRKALVIGAGLLLDVPLKELAQEFDEVILTDIFFLQEALDEIKQYDNCRFEQLDISSVLKEAYYIWRNYGKQKEEFDKRIANLIYRRPNHFLQEENLDYVLSCNLLSQLSMSFEGFIEKKKIELTDNLKVFLESFANNHIEYLKTFPEKTLIHLITDSEKIVFDKEGKALESAESFDTSLLKNFDEQNSWIWNLADYGELDERYALKLKVLSVLN